VRIATRPRPRPRTVALASVALAVPLWAACGSTGSGGGAASAHPSAAVCQKLLAVFSDGPDPDADPVGYALSQILPLGEVHTADPAVSATLHSLMVADRALVKSNGADKTATADIKKADKSLNTACPGVAP
jgi:hypothetical protein